MQVKPISSPMLNATNPTSSVTCENSAISANSAAAFKLATLTNLPVVQTADGSSTSTFFHRVARNAIAAPAHPPPPQATSPPGLRVRVAMTARKRARVSEPEEEEKEQIEERKEDARIRAQRQAPTAPEPASAAPSVPEPTRRFLSVAEAAAHEGLPKGVVQAWVAQGLLVTLKPGLNNSRRLVDHASLRERVEMEIQRERALAVMRKQLNSRRVQRRHDDDDDDDDSEEDDDDDDEGEQEEEDEELEWRYRRILLFVRLDEEAAAVTGSHSMRAPGSDSKEDGELEQQQQQALSALTKQLDRAAGITNPATRMVCQEVGRARDVHRPGLRKVMEHIFERKIDRLVLFSRDDICDAASWSLFEFLCQSHDVDITCVTQPVPA